MELPVKEIILTYLPNWKKLTLLSERLIKSNPIKGYPYTPQYNNTVMHGEFQGAQNWAHRMSRDDSLRELYVCLYFQTGTLGKKNNNFRAVIV